MAAPDWVVWTLVLVCACLFVPVVYIVTCACEFACRPPRVQHPTCN